MKFIRAAVKFFLAIAAGLALTGCDRNNSQSAASVVPPQPMFKLVAYGRTGHLCKVQFMLYNKHPERIDAISIAVTGKLDYEKRTSRLVTEYVPSKGDSGFFYGSFLSECDRQCKLEVQDIDYCKIGGKSYSNCLDYLEVKSEDPKCSISIVKK
jgi:hypothetical protein